MTSSHRRHTNLDEVFLGDVVLAPPVQVGNHVLLSFLLLLLGVALGSGGGSGVCGALVWLSTQPQTIMKQAPFVKKKKIHKKQIFSNKGKFMSNIVSISAYYVR